MANAQRQAALGQANQLNTDLRQQLPAENASYEHQRQSVGALLKIIKRRKVHIRSLLQNVVFTDITDTDAGVIALNEWNTVLRESLELLQMAQMCVSAVEQKQYKVYSKMQEFIFELHKVVSRIIFQVGEISVRVRN
jgi:hypothetical protein